MLNQKSAQKWHCNLSLQPLATSCAKDYKGHSLVQTSFTEPPNSSSACQNAMYFLVLCWWCVVGMACSVWHLYVPSAALLASQAMPDVYRADVYQQLEWVLLDAHAVLLEMLSASGKDEELIAQRCERLSALIDSATIPQNAQLLDLQERVR